MFFIKYSDKLNWNLISRYQKLSENFIKKHSDKVNWYEISYYQKLSGKFIKRNVNKINFTLLMMNKNISDGIKNEILTLKEII
jgi:hypothetical protein